MQIVVSVLPVDQSIPGPPGTGWWVFSKNVVLERYDASTPGNGLPTNAQQRRVGSYSGLVTTLRVAAAISFISRAAISSNTRPYSSSTLWPTRLCRPVRVTARGIVYLA